MKNKFQSLFRWTVLLYICTIAASSVTTAAEPFFQSGHTSWTIEVNSSEDETLLFARTELQRALKLISGAEFPDFTPNQNTVAESSSETDCRIVICVDPSLASVPDTVCVRTVGDNRLVLTGGSSRSALYAVYEFLRGSLGARWLWPGDDGEFLPKKSQWTLPKIDRSFVPPFKYRGFHMCGDWYRVHDFHLWMARNMMNSHRHGNHNFPDHQRGFYRIYSNHNVHPAKESFETHPEYFALRNGNRLASQVCLSNADGMKEIAARLAEELRSKPGIDVLSLFLPDNQEYCQCHECSKKSVSTAFFDFYNGLTDILKTEFPNLKFATLAYQGYLDVPDNPVRNSEFVEIATHGRCNIHLYGDQNCQRNVTELARMNQWKAAGNPIGNYAYEYDLFSHDLLFLPFFDVIDDIIQTNRRLGSVIVLPEVCLSPRNGPEDKVGTYTNRISIYLMARLMADPNADWQSELRDYCENAFGPAAEPIYEYLIAMNRQWSGLSVHRGILGAPSGLANLMITPEIRQMALAKFAEATHRLQNAAENAAEATAETTDADNAAALAGYRVAVEREKVLFSDWCRLVESGVRFEMPHVSDPKAADAGTVIPGLSARLCWTDDAITVKDFRTPVELALSTGMSGETWYFSIDTDDTASQRLVSDVGVEDRSWSVPWTGSKSEMTIPYTSLPTPSPKATSLWQFKIKEGSTASGTAQVYPPVSKDTSTGADGSSPWAQLSFSPSSKTGRVIAYWPGSRERDQANDPNLRATFRNMGWDLIIAQSKDEFMALKPTAFWLKNPVFENIMPDECWEKVRLGVENGATAVFLSYSSLPLDKYFNDPSWGVKVFGGARSITLAERRSNFILDGQWSQTPVNLIPALKNQITPAYELILQQPETWHILATMPKSSQELTERQVYLALRRYGKGVVIIMGADPRFSYPGLLENIQTHMMDFEFTTEQDKSAGSSSNRGK